MEEILGTIYANCSNDFFRGICPISRTIRAEQHDLAVVIVVRGTNMKEKQLGNIYGFDGGNYAGNVYDKDSLAPTIRTFQGINQQPMIVAMRGRNPNNPSDRTAGNPTEQRLEPNSQGICNTLTSVQKDNMVLEKSIIQRPRGFNAGGEHKICPPITSHSFQENNLLKENYKIRKLTPLECWRLMGFSDEDFLSAKLGSKESAKETLEKYPHLGKRAFTEVERLERMSNTQLYKQAGNSIVKNVLVAIIGQMFEGCEDIYKNR